MILFGRSGGWEITKTDAGWHFRFRAKNGRIVVWSECYKRLNNALKGLRCVLESATAGEVVVRVKKEEEGKKDA